MRYVRNRPGKILSFIYKVLLGALAVLILTIIGGLLYRVFFYSPPAKNLQNAAQRPAAPQRPAEAPRINSRGQAFTGIGQMRVPTKDVQPEMVIILVSFVYYPEDRAFSEELTLRIRDFRGIIEKYIASYSAAELQKMGEDKIKAELLHRFNGILRLGKIETLYFSEFMILG